MVELLGLGFWAASIANVFASKLANKLPWFVSLGNTMFIPGLSADLVQAKNTDIWWMIVFFGVGIGLSFFRTKPRWIWTVWGMIAWLQTTFVRFSGVEVLVFFAVAYVLGSGLFDLGKIKLDPIKIFNALSLGFWLMLVVKFVNPNLIWNIGVLVLPLAWYTSERSTRSLFKSPGHLIFLLACINPWSLIYVTGIGLLAAIACLRWNYRPSIDRLYIGVGVLFLIYDPIFRFGNFDTVEEGFWVGWVYRLLRGQVLYRDVMVYHPPIVVWFLAGIVKIAGETVANIRLGLVFLKMVGALVLTAYFWHLTKKPVNRVLTLGLFLALTFFMVKNNVEFRLGMGLLGLLMWRKYEFTKSKTWPLLAGIFSGLALGVSVETGVAAILAGGLASCLFKKKLVWIVGLGFGLLAWVGPLVLTGGLPEAITQIGFYVRAFTMGYFNQAIPRLGGENILFGWQVFKMAKSEMAWWLIVPIMTLVAAIVAWRKKNFWVICCVLFSLVVSRSALGRSDWYHLLFWLLPILGVFVWASEVNDWKMNWFWALAFLVVGFEMVGGGLGTVFLLRMQSYGKVPQTVLDYKTTRMGILADIDAPVDDTDRMVEYIDENSKPDERIFAYPWRPEIYFLTDRANATSVDTPYAFFDLVSQRKMIDELERNSAKFVVYEPDMNFGNLNAGALKELNDYLKANYQKTKVFGRFQVLNRI